MSGFVRAPAEPSRLGVVSGQRRMGKTFLLRALTEATGGFHFVATDDIESEELRRFGEALAAHAGGEFHFGRWDEAIAGLYAAVPDGVIVLDEFPYLVNATPALPKLLQRALGRGGAARRSRARLLLCGNSGPVMSGLLAGDAPLRGRASLELVLRPMDHRVAAVFWGCDDDPELAVLLHSIVGGTPAYRREFVNSDVPEGRGDFDSWVIRTVLNPAMPLFREARHLLVEETQTRGPAAYHAVLAAIAAGNTTQGAIAEYLRKQSTHIGHHLNVLAEAGLIASWPDLFKAGWPTYRIAAPLLAFYEGVMRRNWSVLERGMASTAWPSARQMFFSQVVGPHFENLCREHAVERGTEIFGETPGTVASGTVADPARRYRIKMEVAVLATDGAVLSLGCATWHNEMGIRHLNRLLRARALLRISGYDTSRSVLACYGGAGFDRELTAAAGREHALLVDLPALYSASVGGRLEVTAR